MWKLISGLLLLDSDFYYCITLLGREGIGLCIIEAYILANEINKFGTDCKQAFENYENILFQFLKQKQKGAIHFMWYFAPENRWRIFLRNLAINITRLPLFSKLFLRGMFQDNIELPEYNV